MSATRKLKIPYTLQEDVSKTSEAHHKKQDAWALDAFKNHLLEQVVDHPESQVWYCGRPDKSSVFHFYVAFVPHAILVYGDIGDMLIRPGWNRGLGWLRGAMHDGKGDSFGYLLGKVPGKHSRTEFMPGDVIEYLIQCVKDEPDDFEQYRKLIDDWGERASYQEGEQAWHAAANNSDAMGWDTELIYGFTDYDSEMYWCAYALRWFIREWVKLNGNDGRDDE